MNKLKLLILTFPLILFGCGKDIPDSSDISKELSRNFAACDYIKIDNVEKINGAETNDPTLYKVAFKYRFTFKPAPGSEKLRDKFEYYASIAKEVEKLNEAWRKADREKRDLDLEYMAEIRKLEHETNSSKLSRNTPEWENFLEQQKEKVEDLELSISERLEDIQININSIQHKTNEKMSLINGPDSKENEIKKMMGAVFKTCKANTRYSNDFFFKYLISPVNHERNIFGFSMNVENQIIMKKTEKGWIFNL